MTSGSQPGVTLDVLLLPRHTHTQKAFEKVTRGGGGHTVSMQSCKPKLRTGEWTSCVPSEQKLYKSHRVVLPKSWHDMDTRTEPQPMHEARTRERERSLCCCQPLRSRAHSLLQVTQPKLTDTSRKSPPCPSASLVSGPGLTPQLLIPPSPRGGRRNVSHSAGN